MNISLVDVDGHNYPNLALMKLSAWHKAQGDAVDWYSPLFSRPDKIYASKVFTFTPDYREYAPDTPEPVKGGTGYGIMRDLPPEIESMTPDYSLYPQVTEAYGFLTRGCVRNCPWCIVPRKEGAIRAVAEIGHIAAGRKSVILMDNNFLAAHPEFVREQLEKAARMELCLDFNQGLDARLVTPENARLLARCKWTSNGIRFACDTTQMLDPVYTAVKMLRKLKYKKDFSIYVLAREPEETLERIYKLKAMDRRIFPKCQPYRDYNNSSEPAQILKDIARWCNRPNINRKTPKFENYKPRKEA